MSHWSKRFLSLALVLCMVGLSGCFGGGRGSEEKADSSQLSDGKYTSLSYAFTDIPVTDADSALQAIASVGGALGITDPGQELKAQRVDAVDGTSFYRFEQYHAGIPVYGRSVVVAADSQGAANALTANFSAMDFTPNLDKKADSAAIEKAISQYASKTLGWKDCDITISPESMEQPVIYDLDGEAHLAYPLEVTFAVEDGMEQYTVIADYNDGSVLSAVPVLCSAAAPVHSDTGETATGWVSDEGVYELYNDAYKIKVLDYRKVDPRADVLTLKNTSESDVFDADAVTMLNTTIDYAAYFRSLGFAGFDIYVSVINAAFDGGGNAQGGAMYTDGMDAGYLFTGYVTGPADTDILGHEYTHSVSKTIVSWVASGESGAIDEAYSDIFGELMEQRIKGLPQPDWMIRLDHNGLGRNLADPASGGTAATYQQAMDSIPGGDPHTASTLISHAAYLMWNGIDGDDTMKIGSDALAKLWFRSMFLLQSNATFRQCANAVIVAAKQLCQDGVLNARQLSCVQEAFQAVGIGTDVTDYSVAAKGSTVFAVDVKTGGLCRNYHISIQRVREFGKPLNTQEDVGKIVAEADVTDDAGYKLDLPEGTYTATVRDNTQNGSPYTYSTTVRILGDAPESGGAFGQGPGGIHTQGQKPANIYIYTDFRAPGCGGTVTDTITGEPVSGATIHCVADGVELTAISNLKGEFYISHLTEGASYTLYATGEGYVDSEPVPFTFTLGMDDVPLKLTPEWAEPYAAYLLENQTMGAGLMGYNRGEGRFLLAHISDDSVPELLIITPDGTSLIYTYHKGKVQSFPVVSGSTDLPYFDYRELYARGDGTMLQNQRWGEGRWACYTPSSYSAPGVTLSTQLFISNGSYYCNEYDEYQLYRDGYSYLKGYRDNAVSQTEYESRLDTFNPESYQNLSEMEVHAITPGEIEAVFHVK